MSGEDRPDRTAEGAETLIDVLRAATAEGYDDQFSAVPGGVVRCGECPEPVAAERLSVRRVHRLEGASDAADMMIVVWVDCPMCATKGTLTLGYGPNADEADSDVLSAIDLHDATTDPVD